MNLFQPIATIGRHDLSHKSDAIAREISRSLKKSCKPPFGSKATDRSDNDSVGHMAVWVDKQSHLSLKTEALNPTGVVIDQSEVTEAQINVAIPDATFRNTTPPGATIHTFTGGDGAGVKRSLLSSGFGKPAALPTP